MANDNIQSSKNSMGGLLYIKLLTPMHIGSSESGIVDRPIQRDHLGLPIIFSSSLKGALKRQVSIDNKEDIFGNENSKPGSVAFLDARPLFIPARSLIGTYVLVTSPYLLRILKDYCEITGVDYTKELFKSNNQTTQGNTSNAGSEDKKSGNTIKDIISLLNKKLEKGKAILINNDKRSIVERGDKQVYINEYLLDLLPSNNNSDNDLRNLINNLTNLINKILEDVELKDEPVLIVSDHDIVDIINRSIIIYWRNRLKDNEKVTDRGGLWSEEYVPELSVFISGYVRTKYKSESENNKSNSSDPISNLRNSLDKEIFTIGGLETIGKGIVKIYVKYDNEPKQ